MPNIPLTVIDVETGGLNPQTNALLSIGLVSMQSGKELYIEVKPFNGARINASALAINGFTFKDCESPKRIRESHVVEMVVEFFGNTEPRTLAGQNISFDFAFLNNLFERNCAMWIFGHRTFDLHAVAVAEFIRNGDTPPLKNMRSDLDLVKIADLWKVPQEPIPHNALEGARVTARAIEKILCQEKQNA